MRVVAYWPMSDDDRTPMTRTELAMLWDLLNQWDTTHVGRRPAGIHIAPLLSAIDAELAERFGG